jgi:FkbH-like protein
MSNNEQQIKCVIWDLDNTVWEGVLSEGGAGALLPGVAETIRELDRRGIVQSVSSKNDLDNARKQLEEKGLWDYFLCPQISWNSKSEGIRTILELLNIKEEAAAFVDDSAFERDEVRFVLPKIRAYDAALAGSIPGFPEFQVRFVTEDAARRREMYRADLERQSAEEAFAGSNEDFLSTLHMKLAIEPVTEPALQRVEELTIRTHQLNSTGYTYSYEELLELIRSPRHRFYICELTDDYGTSGKVGLLLMEESEEALTIKLLIVSCRVMTRGIGTALLCFATKQAAETGKPLRAEFLETDYNRIMYITYKLSGFEEIEEDGDRVLLEYQHAEPMEYPEYLEIQEGGNYEPQ